MLALRATAQGIKEKDSEQGSPMELFFWAFVGGLAGTGLMDIAESLMERFRITSGRG